MMNLNSAISERSQTQKVTYCMVSLRRNSTKGKTTVIESRSMVDGEWRDGNVLY